jgi:hypothetical protein
MANGGGTRVRQRCAGAAAYSSLSTPRISSSRYSTNLRKRERKRKGVRRRRRTRHGSEKNVPARACVTTHGVLCVGAHSVSFSFTFCPPYSGSSTRSPVATPVRRAQNKKETEGVSATTDFSFRRQRAACDWQRASAEWAADARARVSRCHRGQRKRRRVVAPSGRSAPSLSRRPGPTAMTRPSFTCCARVAPTRRQQRARRRVSGTRAGF